jgi:hypothetical protein
MNADALSFESALISVDRRLTIDRLSAASLLRRRPCQTRLSKHALAIPEALRLLAPQRGLIAIDSKALAPEVDLPFKCFVLIGIVPSAYGRTMLGKPTLPEMSNSDCLPGRAGGAERSSALDWPFWLGRQFVAQASAGFSLSYRTAFSSAIVAGRFEPVSDPGGAAFRLPSRRSRHGNKCPNRSPRQSRGISQPKLD